MLYSGTQLLVLRASWAYEVWLKVKTRKAESQTAGKARKSYILTDTVISDTHKISNNINVNCGLFLYTFISPPWRHTHWVNFTIHQVILNFFFLFFCGSQTDSIAMALWLDSKLWTLLFFHLHIKIFGSMSSMTRYEEAKQIYWPKVKQLYNVQGSCTAHGLVVWALTGQYSHVGETSV